MRRHRLSNLLWVVPLITALWIIAEPQTSQAQIRVAPGSAARGSQLFQEKECLRCHSFQGRGAKTAPDLSQRSERAYTPALLASVMWNHSPTMWKALGRNATRPQMSSMETADLFAYFYSMFYFTIPGDAARGKVVFEEKNCAGCHTTQSSGSQARPISRWSKVKDPIVWAERMWNHSREMHREMTRKGLSWPKMSGQNMVDLLVFVRSLPAARSQEAAFEPGEPPLGRVVFERNCERCHTFGSKQYGKIDLVERPGPRSLTDYIASMWNHAPLMRTMAGPNFVPLSPGDMTNLVAYLYAERYFFEKGSEDRGASVYREKGCATCHEQRRGTTNAPDLTQVSELFTPVTMAAAVWRHGPSMLEVMNRERIQWPEFHGSEMSNIIAYLNSRVVPRMAPVKP